MKVNIPAVLPATPSVFKVQAGKRFYYGHSQSIEWAVKSIRSSYFKYTHKGLYVTDLYYPLVKYCHDNSIQTVTLTILFATDDGYQLLKYELERLEEDFGKPECINTNNTPYVPKTVHAKKGSNWLTQNQFLNFKKLLSKYEY